MLAMQTLDIVSVNLWLILISLANLVLIFLIVKKFLFKPVQKVLDQRQKEVDERYSAADDAKRAAEADRNEWAQTVAGARAEADGILKTAVESAKHREAKILSDANERAGQIVRTAQTEAELERRRAEDQIKREIVEVSEALAEKMLSREINSDDHRAMIDSFLQEMGDDDD